MLLPLPFIKLSQPFATRLMIIAIQQLLVPVEPLELEQPQQLPQLVMVTLPQQRVMQQFVKVLQFIAPMAKLQQD